MLIHDIQEYLKKEQHLVDEDILWRKYLPSFLRINNNFLKGAQDYFQSQDYTICYPSILVGVLGACENFNTAYKIKQTEQGYQLLTQTAQLQLERALSFNLDKVACITKSFRNENSITDGRHLREFTLIELELANKELDQLLDTIEACIKYIIDYGLSKQTGEIEQIYGINIEKKLDQFVRNKYLRITYDKAILLLKRNGIGIEWGNDLKSQHEQKIVELHGNKPTFITHFPEHIKFFNMRLNRENPRIVNSADLILPISGEAVGSAEREYDYNILRKRFLESSMYTQMQKVGITEKDLGCYFIVVEKGEIPPHAGCGIGFERVLQSVLSDDVTDIRLFSQPYILNRLLGVFV